MRDPMQNPSGGSEPEASGRIPFSQQAWTLDTLKVHFDSRIEDLRRYFADVLSIQEQTNRDRFTNAEKAVQTAMTSADKAVQAAMAASKEAILKAETAADKRAEASNEIRAAMIDQQRNFASKDETERRLKMLEDASLAASSKTIGASQLYAAATAIVAAVGIIIAIIFNFAP